MITDFVQWWFSNYFTSIVGSAFVIIAVIGIGIGALVTSDWNQPCYTKKGGCK